MIVGSTFVDFSFPLYPQFSYYLSKIQSYVSQQNNYLIKYKIYRKKQTLNPTSHSNLSCTRYIEAENAKIQIIMVAFIIFNPIQIRKSEQTKHARAQIAMLMPMILNFSRILIFDDKFQNCPICLKMYYFQSDKQMPPKLRSGYQGQEQNCTHFLFVYSGTLTQRQGVGNRHTQLSDVLGIDRVYSCQIFSESADRRKTNSRNEMDKKVKKVSLHLFSYPLFIQLSILQNLYKEVICQFIFGKHKLFYKITLQQIHISMDTQNKKNKGAKKKYRPDKFIIQPIISVNGKSTQKIYFKLGLLGKGGFANCYATQCLGNDKLMATKVIKKSQLKSNRTKMRLMNQIKNHKTFRHLNIVEFYHYFQDYENVYLNLELCENQSLNQLLKIRDYLTLLEVQSILYGICNGVQYLHSKKYIHRDLKLANIFLDQNFIVKIGDFGLTSQLEFIKENKRTVCGTPNYIAPEILQGTGYSFSVDIWAIGVIIFTLFYGFPPFQSQETHLIYSKIKKNQYSFPKASHVPIQAIYLIKKILVNDPNKRPTLNQILLSPFMKLGKGIPLTLPDICGEEIPSKSDFDDIKFFKIEEETQDTFLKLEKETDTVVFEKEETCIKTNKKLDNFMKTNLISQKNKEPPEVYVLDVEEVQQNIFYFCTNTLNLGIYEKNQSIQYRNLAAFMKKEDTINSIKIDHNLFHEVQKIPFTKSKYRALLNCKYKNLSIKENKNNINKIFYPSKIHKYKDMLMIRLSNKSIQIIFDSKDGFIYESKSEKLYLFKNIQLISSSSYLIEIEVASLMEKVANYMQITQKGKQGRKITLQTYVSSVHTNEEIKININKMKAIYGIINEYKMKKQVKTHQYRNSQ